MKFTCKVVRILKGHEQSNASVKFSPNGLYLASSGGDGEARIWGVEDDNCIFILRCHEKGISDISWSPDSQHLATSSDDKSIKIWSPSFPTTDTSVQILDKCSRTLNGHLSFVFCAQFGPTGGMLVSGSFDESIRVWDVREGKCLKAIAAHGDPVTSITFSPDGSLMASSSYDGLIRVWDASSARCIRTVVGDDNPAVSGITFSPNGLFILSASLDSTLRLWSLQTSKCVKTYTGHSNIQYCIPPRFIVLSEGGESWVGVVMGDETGRVFIWDLNERSLVFEEQISQCPIISIDVHPTKPLVAVCALKPDLEIRILELLPITEESIEMRE